MLRSANNTKLQPKGCRINQIQESTPIPLQSNPSHAESLQQIIRILGKILGNVIHRNNGAPMFQRIEQLRRTAVGLRRQSIDQDSGPLTQALSNLPPKEAQTVARAFTYFLH